MMASVERALIDAEPHAVELLRQLVRKPSLGPHAAATREALDVLAEFLRRVDLDVDIRESPSGVPTLLACMDSGTPGPNILLQGHMDVVPVDVQWERDPFGAVIEDGFLHGRGSCDMKAGIASFAGVVSALRSTGSLEPGHRHPAGRRGRGDR